MWHPAQPSVAPPPWLHDIFAARTWTAQRLMASMLRQRQQQKQQQRQAGAKGGGGGSGRRGTRSGRQGSCRMSSAGTWSRLLPSCVRWRRSPPKGSATCCAPTCSSSCSRMDSTCPTTSGSLCSRSPTSGCSCGRRQQSWQRSIGGSMSSGSRRSRRSRHRQQRISGGMSRRSWRPCGRGCCYPWRGSSSTPRQTRSSILTSARHASCARPTSLTRPGLPGRRRQRSCYFNTCRHTSPPRSSPSPERSCCSPSPGQVAWRPLACSGAACEPPAGRLPSRPPCCWTTQAASRLFRFLPDTPRSPARSSSGRWSCATSATCC